jgi:hypothetical protein
MKKLFQNCDVFSVLQEIVERRVKHYKTDFEIDKEIILEASESDDPKHLKLLWLARPNGTHCFVEADVYVKDTYPYNAWVFYGEQTNDPITAYAIELQESRFDGKIIGNLYELDYQAHFKRIQKYALPRSPVTQIHTPPLDEEKWLVVLDEAQAERYDENYKIYDKYNYQTAFETKRHTRKVVDTESGAEM